MATRPFTFRALQAKMLYNNTRQGYAARSPLKPAGYSFPVNTPAKPMPSPVGMLKSCGFFISAAQPNAYFGREVLPHVPDAWVDVGIVDYETPFNRHFYQYQPPCSLEAIDADLDKVSREIMELLAEVHS